MEPQEEEWARMESDYLRGIEPLPDELLRKASKRNMSRADANRWRREVAKRKKAIRAAREAANAGRPAEATIRPTNPFGVC